MDSIGQRVKILRQTRGVSQSELSRRVNVTPQAIQSLESDKNPNRKTRHVVGIASALDFDPTYLDLSTSLDQFREKLNSSAGTVLDMTRAADVIDNEDGEDLIDAAINQARKNVSLRLRLSGETVSGREYLERLSEELRRLTSDSSQEDISSPDNMGKIT